MKYSAELSIINQVGLTLFHHNSDENLFTASPYNFFICPRAFGPIDDTIAFSSSTLEFLADHNFDFNQVTNVLDNFLASY